jgi:L-seryl-tRNA(Ser) seleniumtransferase
MKPTRRSLLRASAAVAPLAAGARTARGASKPTGVYTALGVKPVINGMGTVTVLGGSLMPPEVVRAMDEAAQSFIHLPELQKKAGERIARLLDVPGAMVTGGAASAITAAMVACMARGDRR